MAEKGRELKTIKLGDYELLNDEKLGRVFDLKDGVGEHQESELKALESVKGLAEDAGALALYDRYGGAVKYKGRKLAMGTFWNFEQRKPQEKVVIKEEDFEDEYVLKRKTKKETKKGIDELKSKVKKLEKLENGQKGSAKKSS